MSKPQACDERDGLIGKTEETLLKMADLAKNQAEALRNGNENVVMAIDKQIEMTLGDKERLLGALQEHRAEHGC
jgi:hypothetical protein